MRPKEDNAKNFENDSVKSDASENNFLGSNHSENDSKEIVRSELNLEKWSIWEPSSTQKIPRPRTLERVRILADGSRITAKVEIGFTQHGNLSTRDQKIYYVLLKMWDDAGRPEEPVMFSLQKIARALGEEWGSVVRRSITRSLLQLRGVLFVWENSYFDKSSGEHLEILDTFNILSELTLARRSKKMHATNEMCQFQFHRQILRNLEANYTTPIFLATVLKFRGEIAQLLYVRLDLLMADKSHYERRSKELFEDLGLESETYRHPSARKRVLERALRELEDVPMTTGGTLKAHLEKTQDGTDYKIVIRRAAPQKRKNAAKASKSGAIFESNPSVGIFSETSRNGFSGPARGVEEPDDALLVRYFHQQFHSASLKSAINPKELVQAARLIQQHGFESAMALVDYAREEAAKTSYAPASLNGIVQYESRFESAQTQLVAENQQKRERQEAQRCAQVAQQARQDVAIAELTERVGQVKASAPGAFTAFLRHVEIERDQFLQTPVARQAKPEIQSLLAREYERPAKRLELFIDFFKIGSVGEALLSMSVEGKMVIDWLQSNGESARLALKHGELQADVASLLHE